MDIFIGYKSEDRERVRRIAAALTDIGYSVFWDQTIPPGSTWRQTIGKALEDSQLVIICWSKATLDSDAAKWVLDEADEAARTKKPLIPVRLDDVAPPLGHRQVQALDLAGWNGHKTAPEFAQLQFVIAEALAGAGRSVRTIDRRSTRKGRAPFWLAGIVAALGAGFVAGQVTPLPQLLAAPPVLVPGLDPQLLDIRVAAVVNAQRRGANAEPMYGTIMGGNMYEALWMGSETAYACIDFADGGMFEGTLKRANRAVVPIASQEVGGYVEDDDLAAMFDVTGFGVMWKADGSVDMQGRWESGQLIEAFDAPAGYALDPVLAVKHSQAPVGRPLIILADESEYIPASPGAGVQMRGATLCKLRPGEEAKRERQLGEFSLDEERLPDGDESGLAPLAGDGAEVEPDLPGDGHDPSTLSPSP